MKRVFLFVVTNLAILLVLSIVAHLVGVDAGVDGSQRMQGLLAMAAVFGFGGAFISLLISKWSAKRMMGVRVIAEPQNDSERWLVNTVSNLARAANIGMPEVGIFDSPQPNAFATGPRRNSALVAVSTGLLRSMKPEEVEGVLGHELTHVSNGDMVTMTLIQGVLNTFVIFLSRALGGVVDRAVFGQRERGNGVGYFVTVMVLQVVFGIVASFIVCAFSRGREFRADAGGAHLAGREKMIGALERLKAAHPEPLPEQMRAFGIAGDAARGLAALLRTHPPLDDRIAALRAMTS
jgi:heat shock protein HtpX